MPGTGATEADRLEIVRIIHSIFDGFMNGDIDAMNASMSPDGTVWDVFQPKLYRGGKDRREFQEGDIAQSAKRGSLTIDIEEPVIDVWENTALARYYLTYEYQPPNAAAGHVRNTDVFRRIDGKWWRMHHHEGTVPTGIPPLDE